MPCRHVFAREDSQEGRQAASLLERGREQARGRRAGRSEARSSPRRDQRLAGTGVAPVDRGAGRGGRSSEDLGVVSRRPLRGSFAGRLDRPAEAVAPAAVPAAAMGRLLAGAVAFGGTASPTVMYAPSARDALAIAPAASARRTHCG